MIIAREYSTDRKSNYQQCWLSNILCENTGWKHNEETCGPDLSNNLYPMGKACNTSRIKLRKRAKLFVIVNDLENVSVAH